MSRKPRVQRTPEEKWEIVLEEKQSGNIAETCRRYGRTRVDLLVYIKSIYKNLDDHKIFDIRSEAL